MATDIDYARYDRVRPIHWTGEALELLDQRKLPFATEYLTCRGSDEVAGAIRDLAVRGAPAIGMAAAWGVVRAAREVAAGDEAVGDRQRIDEARAHGLDVEGNNSSQVQILAQVDVRGLTRTMTLDFTYAPRPVLEVTAVKRAEDREELVVRLLNESAEPRTARVRPFRTAVAARRVNLAEEPIIELPISDGAIEVAAAPWEIVTVGIRFGG